VDTPPPGSQPCAVLKLQDDVWTSVPGPSPFHIEKFSPIHDFITMCMRGRRLWGVGTVFVGEMANSGPDWSLGRWTGGFWGARLGGHLDFSTPAPSAAGPGGYSKLLAQEVLLWSPHPVCNPGISSCFSVRV
jgi:hypothetical protein